MESAIMRMDLEADQDVTVKISNDGPPEEVKSDKGGGESSEKVASSLPGYYQQNNRCLRSRKGTKGNIHAGESTTRPAP